MDEIKNQFPIFKNYPDLVYLDSAATSQKPQIVIDRIVEFYEKENSNVHRGIYELSEKSTLVYENARKTVAEFLKTESKEVIFTSGTTASANIIAQSYLAEHLQTGDVVISSVAEHHSNFLPLQRVIEDRSAVLQLMKLSDDQDYDYTHLESLLKAHGDKVKAVALSAVSNVLGNKLDIKKVTHMVRGMAPSAVLIIDAAQIIGHHEFLPNELDIDFAFFSGHKMFAETGIGVLWAKYDLLKKMPPAILGGGMIDRVDKDKTTFADLPERFEAGTPHISGAVSIAAAIEFIDEIGLKQIEHHHNRLTKTLLERLKEIPEIKIYGPQNLEVKSGVVSFSLKTIHSHDVAQFLSDQNIAVRAGHHCTQILHRDVFDISGSVRASLHVYNNDSDIEKLISALENCINFYKPNKNA